MRNPSWQDEEITPEFVIAKFAQWRADPWRFYTDMVWTADESDLDDPVKPFTPFAYLHEFHKAIESHDTTIVVKGRQMFFTWAVAARFVYNLLFKPYSRSMFMSQRESQVEDVIAKRIVFIIKQLDDRFPWPDFSKKSIKRMSIDHPDGEIRSLIVGTPSGEDQARGMTGTELWFDEFGFLENQDLILKTSRPLIKKGKTKLIITSTPNPDTFYESLVKSIEDGSHKDHMQGVWSHVNENGDFVLSCRYDAHPDQRSEEWAESKRKEVGELAWRVEYGLEWTLPKGKPVFPEFSFDTYCLPYEKHKVPDRANPICLGFDFGGHHPSMVAHEKDSLGRCVMHLAILGEDVDLDSFLVDIVNPALEEKFPGVTRFLIACDPAGEAISGQGVGAPAKEVLENHFQLPVECVRTSPADRARAIKILMNKMKGGTPGILMAPDLGHYYRVDGSIIKGVMIEGFKHGYVYAKKRGARMDSYQLAPHKDGLYDHLFDAWGYRFIYDFPALLEMVSYKTRKETRGSKKKSRKRHFRR